MQGKANLDDREAPEPFIFSDDTSFCLYYQIYPIRNLIPHSILIQRFGNSHLLSPHQGGVQLKEFLCARSQEGCSSGIRSCERYNNSSNNSN